MTGWLRTQRWALTLLVSVVLVFVTTVAYPTWRHYLGSLRPDTTVPVGATIEISGTLWKLRPLVLPTLRRPVADRPPPPDSKLVAYAIDRTRNGRPFVQGEIGKTCDYSVVDTAGRHFTYRGARSVPASVWLDDHEYTVDCHNRGSLGVVLYVPEDAQILGVDIDFARSDGLKWGQHQIVRFMVP